VLVVLLTLFTISFIYVIRGVKFLFVLFLNVLVVMNIIFYIIYAYQHEVTKHHWKTWYWLSTSSFGLYHWLLAFRYYTSACEMPYIINHLVMPDAKRRQNMIVNYSGLTVVTIGSFYTYAAALTALHNILYVIFYIMMVVTAVIMIVALVKIRRCFIDKGLG